MAQFHAKGFRPDIMRRWLCSGLLWDALDNVWVGISPTTGTFILRPRFQVDATVKGGFR